jgi:hypothetical protein
MGRGSLRRGGRVAGSLEVAVKACSDKQSGDNQCLGFTGFLCIHRDDLDSVRVQAGGVVELECDVFDDEGPHLVAEAVGV